MSLNLTGPTHEGGDPQQLQRDVIPSLAARPEVLWRAWLVLLYVRQETMSHDLDYQTTTPNTGSEKQGGNSAKTKPHFLKYHMARPYPRQAKYTAYSAQLHANNFPGARLGASDHSISCVLSMAQRDVCGCRLGTTDVLRHLSHHGQVMVFQLLEYCLVVEMIQI